MHMRHEWQQQKKANNINNWKDDLEDILANNDQNAKILSI